MSKYYIICLAIIVVYSAFKLDDGQDTAAKKSKDTDFLDSVSDAAMKFMKEHDQSDTFDSIFNKELDLDIGMISNH